MAKDLPTAAASAQSAVPRQDLTASFDGRRAAWPLNGAARDRTVRRTIAETWWIHTPSLAATRLAHGRRPPERRQRCVLPVSRLRL